MDKIRHQVTLVQERPLAGHVARYPWCPLLPCWATWSDEDMDLITAKNPQWKGWKGCRGIPVGVRPELPTHALGAICPPEPESPRPENGLALRFSLSAIKRMVEQHNKHTLGQRIRAVMALEAWDALVRDRSGDR